MKKRLSFIAFIMMFVLMFTLVGCKRDPKPSTSGTQPTSTTDQPTSTKPEEKPIDLAGVNSDGVEVKMSVLYDNANTRMRYVSGFEGLPFNSKVENKQYTVNQFKPAWAALQEKQNFKIKDVTPEHAQSITDAYNRFESTQFNNVDILSGSVTKIVDEATQRGSFVNLAPYIKNGTMPYLKKFLDENELVKNTVTSADGEIFYAPYFDGYDDVETMFIVRKDWVEKLLDSDNAAYDTTATLTTWYKPFYKEMNTTFKAMKGEDDTQNVTLTYGNGQGIIDKQNALATKNGSTLTQALKDYIDEHYRPQNKPKEEWVIEKRSDLFCGQNACYNADEMVALMRCVKTNPIYLTKKDIPIYAFYPRDKEYNRTAAIIQLAQLWGVRGYDSRNSYFYINDKGLLADGRTSSDMIEALGFIRQLYLEGLMIQNYDKGLNGAEDYRESLNNNNQGFMTYDYNQTTTIKNETLKQYFPEMNLSPILFPVADWDNKATYIGGNNKVNPVDDGFTGYKVEGNNVLYQYTESWRSIKSEAWTISSATKSNLPVLKKCLEIFDYMYSPEGQILMSYGPDAYLKIKDASVNLNSLVNNLNDADYEDKLQDLVEQKYETIEYYDRQVPAIATLALEELKDKKVGQGNYTNYYRYYVGATLPIGYEKEQGMEYQTVDEKGKVGLDYIVNAVEHYVLRHAQVNRGGNPKDGENQDKNLANSLVPTTFPLTQAENKQLATRCATLGEKFNNAANNGFNEYHNYIMFGFNRSSKEVTTLTPAALVDQVNNTWNGSEFYRQYLTAYVRMYNLGKK